MATITGKWLFNETLVGLPTLSATFGGNATTEFVSNGITFNSMRRSYTNFDVANSLLQYFYFDPNKTTYTTVYDHPTKTWVDEAYRIIDFGDKQVEMSDVFYEWLTENATPVLPDPVPVTPYLPKNGAWQKQDIYKVEGGQWVKQPQAGYETQQGAWQAIFEQQLPEPEPEPEPEPDPLPPIGTSLQDCTWEQISAISAAGKAAEYFSVGDTKSVYLKGTVGTLELDTTLYVYILGFDHNSEIEGKGITFGTFKTADGVDVCLVDSKYAGTNTSGTKYFNMNHWGNYKYGGWAGCDMRYDILGSTDKAPSGYGAAKTTSVVGYDPSDTCATSPVANTLMAALPSELRAVMKPMTKYTDGKGGTSSVAANVVATIDYLPLLAEFEIFGKNSYANLYEQNKQKQYDYFVAGNSKLKYRHSAVGSGAWWWERSAFYSYGHSFCFVNSVGDASHYSVYRVGGIAPIFLV